MRCNACWECRVFFFRQKTAYEMRISDWSSDVCSSDLGVGIDDPGVETGAENSGNAFTLTFHAPFPFMIRVPRWRLAYLPRILEIGRASCRERVCQYV